MKKISAVILLAFSFILLLAFYNLSPIHKVEEVVETKAVEAEPAPKKKVILSTAEKKKRFIEETLPAIERVKARMDEKYRYILALTRKEALAPKEQDEIDRLMQNYKAKDISDLLARLHTHPVSIILAQAALETGWGTSRFYNKANNIFGVWSYDKNEPRIPAEETRGAKTIYVKKYDSLEASVEGYFEMMAAGYAYGKFRRARVMEKNPFKLIAHLTHYSELRSEYVKRLYHVMKSNGFYKYDATVFKPLALNQILPNLKKHAGRDSQTVKSVTASVGSSLAPLNEVKFDGTPKLNANAGREEKKASVAQTAVIDKNGSLQRPEPLPAAAVTTAEL